MEKKTIKEVYGHITLNDGQEIHLEGDTVVIQYDGKTDDDTTTHPAAHLALLMAGYRCVSIGEEDVGDCACVAIEYTDGTKDDCDTVDKVNLLFYGSTPKPTKPKTKRMRRELWEAADANETLTAKRLIALLQKLDPNTVIASKVDSVVRPVSSIMFDDTKRPTMELIIEEYVP